MKLSKNNKHFLSLAFKDKTSNNIYSELKAASICSYSVDIILHMSEKDTIPLNINIEKIENFSDLKNLFENENNHKKLLAKTVIKSENPFIISMLDINKTSKIKYFIELICLNKIELSPEFSFFKDFFDKLHKANFLYLYQTNKLEEYAEIRFILQIESFYQKTFLISKDDSLIESGGNDNSNTNEIIMDEVYKNQIASEMNKFTMNNNTTIKEVTEDEKHFNSNDSMTRGANNKILLNDSMCNVGMNENSNLAGNKSLNKDYKENNKNVESENQKKLNKNTPLYHNKQNYFNNLEFNYDSRSFSYKNKNELKNNLYLELNNDSSSAADRPKPSSTEANIKNSKNLLLDLDFKTKGSNDNQKNISQIKEIKINSTRSEQEDFMVDDEDKSNKKSNNKKNNIINSDENNFNNKSLNFDNNIDFDVEPKASDKAFEEYNEANKSVKSIKKVKSNIPEPDKEMENEDNSNIYLDDVPKATVGTNEEDNPANKSVKSINKAKSNIPEPCKEMENEESFVERIVNKSSRQEETKENIKDVSQRSRNVFLTGGDTATKKNIQNSDNNIKNSHNEIQHSDINIKNTDNYNNKNEFLLNDSFKKDNRFSNDTNSEAQRETSGHNNNNNNNNNNTNSNYNEQQNQQNTNIDNESFKNKKINNNVASGGSLLMQNVFQNENESNFNYVFSNNDLRSEIKEIEKQSSTNNNFFSTNINPSGTFYSNNKKREFPEDQIFQINLNLANYNFLYVDLDYTMSKNMKSNLEKICKFVQWAWENFRYIKFVIYLPKIQDFFLNMNQDLLKEISEIFSIADILLFEKKELLLYKNSLYEISEFQKNQTASQFFSFNNTASSFFSNNTKDGSNNFKSNQQQKINNSNKWEEFFLSKFKIKKRSVPLLVYPTKTLVVLDELSSIIIYEKNYENKLIFKTETNFILHPQINHTNQNIVELYRNCLAENYTEIRGIFFGGFLSKIMQKPVKVGTIVSRDYTGAYMISIELAKKFLNLFLEKKPYPHKTEFYEIKLDKIIANTKLCEDIHRRRESRFVLDCVNTKKSFLKIYEPLNDHYLKDFFGLRSVSNTMRSFGFEKNKGKFVEPDKINKQAETLKIGGKFLFGNNNPLKNIHNNCSNKINNNFNVNINNNFNNAFEAGGSTNSKSNRNLNMMMGLDADSPRTNTNNFMFSNYNNFNLNNLNSNSNAAGKKASSLLTRAKPQNLNFNYSSGSNFSEGNKFSAQISNKDKVHSVFGKLNLPRLVTPQVKIDPEEQIRNYFEFEKNLIMN